MNVDRLRQLADYVEEFPASLKDYYGNNRRTLPAGIFMGNWRVYSIPSCGTIGCLAGHAADLFDPDCSISTLPEVQGRIALGLTGGEAGAFFYDWPQKYAKEITGKHCAYVLRTAADNADHHAPVAVIQHAWVEVGRMIGWEDYPNDC